MSKGVAQKNHAKVIFIVVAIFIILTALVFYYGIFPNHNPVINIADVKIDGVVLPRSQEINHFELTDNTGKNFTNSNLQGHWTMMFFGFTNCGDVCPTTLSELNKMYKSLQAELPDNKLPQVLMISVDAERDSIKKINNYVTAFNPHFIGAKGKDTELMSLEKQLHMVSAKMQAEGQSKDHYTINHSAEIILFNPEGQVQAFMSYPHEAAQMAKDYKAILTAAKIIS